MIKNEWKNFIILLGVFISASFLRVVLNNHVYITNVVASINVIAFWYVVYDILEKAQNKLMERISKDDKIGELVRRKKKKYFKNRRMIFIFISFILGVLYIVVLANPIINDIISLGALFLSIESDYIYDFIQDIFYKLK